MGGTEAKKVNFDEVNHNGRYGRRLMNSPGGSSLSKKGGYSNEIHENV